MPDEPAQEGQVRDDAFDLGLGERLGEPVEGLRARLAVRDQLGDHRVVGDPDLVAFLDSRVDANAVGQAEPLQAAGLGEEGARVLGVEPHLDGVAAELGAHVERLTGRDLELGPDEIDVRDELGHRVLDLDASVQLEEEEVAPFEHELGRPGAPVADPPGERDRRVLHAGAELRVERGGGRLLQHLLVATLDRALALAERDHVVVVPEELDLDVARALDEALAEDAVVAEGRGGLAAGGRERLDEVGRVAHHAHAAAAAPRGRLHDEREADLLRLALRDDGHAGLARDRLRRQLVASATEGLGRRTDPRQPGRLHGLGEVGTLGEEAVAGMDRVGPCRAGGTHVLLRVEVARDLDGLVGGPRVERAAIVRRDDRDGADPELAAGAEDAKRDLAAVRDEELPDGHGEGLYEPRRRPPRP